MQCGGEECTLTLEKDDRVFITLWLGTLHSSIQVVRDPRENFGDVLGEAVFKLVIVIAEHLVVLCRRITACSKVNKWQVLMRSQNAEMD